MSGNENGRAPTHWKRMPLGEVVDILDSRRVPVNAKEREGRQGSVPYYGATGQVGWIDDHLFDEELVLLGEDGAPFFDSTKQKAYLVRGRSWVNNHAHVLRTRNGMPSAFLKHQLDQVDYRPFVSGTTRAKLPQGPMRQIGLLVPPVDEQELIVAAIESHISRLDAATATLERVQRNLERYRASVLKAAVEGRLVPTEAELAKKEGRSYEPASVLLKRILAERRRRWEEAELAKLKPKGKPPTDDRWKAKYEEPAAPETDGLRELPEGWCWASIAQVALISGGITKNANREKLPMQRPYLRVANVYANELRLNEIKHIGVSEDEAERTSLLPGDLLIVEGNGSVDQIGRVAMWDGSIPGCVHQNHIIKVRLIDQSLAKWSLSWLLSASGRQHIEGAASSTSGLHTLSLSKVASLPIPLAPSSEQSRVRLEVERLLSEQDHLQGVLSQACHRAVRLRQSILKWAFEGRLVRSAADHPLVDAALAGRR